MADVTAWQDILAFLQEAVAPEDFRRWFSATAYAGDSGDQVTVWVPSEGIRRHIELHYLDTLSQALTAVGRPTTTLRFVVAGFGDEDDG